VAEQGEGGLCSKDHCVTTGARSERCRLCAKVLARDPLQSERSSSGAVKPR